VSEAFLTPERIKAARELLGWSRARLACRAGATEGTFRRYEDGEGAAATLDLMMVRQALESAGVEFVEEHGDVPVVRLRKERA
jgi:transcriptional regulator with XRE-family HTH domain